MSRSDQNGPAGRRPSSRHAVVERSAARLSAGRGSSPIVPEVAVEEPLEIRVAGETLAVTMRTPGDDRELALGFLLAEGVIEGLADVGKIAHCGRIGEAGYGNLIEVLPGPGVALDPDTALGARRGTLTSAACGVCGRATIDDLVARCLPLPVAPRLPVSLIAHAVEQLAQNQPHFARTGGLHAAAALAADGTLLAAREDIGRHNAVDKVVGALLYAGRDPAAMRPAVLAVSGRVSFEIVQKAVAARIPVVVAISAPTSLAIDVAERANITLAGFARDAACTIYTHPERLEPGGIDADGSARRQENGQGAR